MHPARALAFHELLDSLRAAVEQRAVSRRYDVATGLSLYVYTNACVYDDLWSDAALVSRGLILHEASSEVVATPFPKFFNAGEKRGNIPDGPFEAFEKLDGSLIILFWWGGEWRTATKGAFDSEQARWARAFIVDGDLSPLVKGTTYLLEATYPENRIVVFYDRPALVFLAAYGEDGEEVAFKDLQRVAGALGWPIARRHHFVDVADMVARADLLPASEEGFVARWADGTRLKIKGAEYRRIHALISRITPLAMWEAIIAGDDLVSVRQQIPEEFWRDFDAIVGLLEEQVAGVHARLTTLADATASLSDKEVGLALSTYPEDVRGFLFGYRKGGWPKVRDKAFKSLRPTGNRLDGYTPSYAMARVTDEAS